ncbi:hypothetical protein [Nitrospira sp. Kam-Ns4a]
MSLLRGALLLLLVLVIGADLVFEDPSERPDRPVRQAVLLDDLDEADYSESKAGPPHPSDQAACAKSARSLQVVHPERLLASVADSTSSSASFTARLLIPRAPPVA